jgi:hypothetical protein
LVLDKECVLSCVQEVEDVVILLVRLKKAIASVVVCCVWWEKCVPREVLYTRERSNHAAGLRSPFT